MSLTLLHASPPRGQKEELIIISRGFPASFRSFSGGFRRILWWRRPLTQEYGETYNMVMELAPVAHRHGLMHSFQISFMNSLRPTAYFLN